MYLQTLQPEPNGSGNYLKGSSCGLAEILFWNLEGGTEERWEEHESG
jgi:hypothetical protein